MAGIWGRFAAVLLGLLVVLAVAGGAQAKVVLHDGKAYGVFFKPGAVPATQSPVSPFTVGAPQPLVAYGGGPLMLKSHMYLIFWGPARSFASSYSGPIIQWAKDLQTDQALTTNAFSVARQYTDANGQHISDSMSLDGTFFDTTAFPALDTAAGCDAAHAPCLSDAQVRAEIVKDGIANGWPLDNAANPREQYLLLTPSGTSMCMVPGSCTFTYDFCAYHSLIRGLNSDGSTGGDKVAVYSALPDVGWCDPGQAPAGVQGNADTDGTLVAAIHELAESATDPSPGSGYLDSNAAELADKCYPPLVTSWLDVYGTPLGGSLADNTAFNQLIGGHSYYTQMLWSNASTATPSSTAAAGCVQRIGPSPSFLSPGLLQTGRALTFDGSVSSEVDQPITAYTWSWGDGSPDSSGVIATHVYTKPGTYTVSLTVSDAGGAKNASTAARVFQVTSPTLSR